MNSGAILKDKAAGDTPMGQLTLTERRTIDYLAPFHCSDKVEQQLNNYIFLSRSGLLNFALLNNLWCC